MNFILWKAGGCLYTASYWGLKAVASISNSEGEHLAWNILYTRLCARECVLCVCVYVSEQSERARKFWHFMSQNWFFPSTWQNKRDIFKTTLFPWKSSKAKNIPFFTHFDWFWYPIHVTHVTCPALKNNPFSVNFWTRMIPPFTIAAAPRVLEVHWIGKINEIISGQMAFVSFW